MNAPCLMPLRLPYLDPALARTRSHALAALQGLSLESAPLVAALAADDRADAWVMCADGLAVAPVAIDGRRVALRADDGHPDAVAAMAALAAIEPMLVLVETALGVALQPAGLAAVAPADAIIIAITAAGHRLLLAVAPDAPLRPSPARANVDTVAARWTLQLAAPALRRLPERGDLLTGVAATGFVAVAGHELPVQWAPGPGSHLMVTANWRASMAEADPTPGFDIAAAAVPVVVSIDGGTAPIGELARLTPGSILALPGEPSRLAVTVLAGGAPLATGTLVAVGDGHGVLIDQVFRSGQRAG